MMKKLSGFKLVLFIDLEHDASHRRGSGLGYALLCLVLAECQGPCLTNYFQDLC